MQVAIESQNCCDYQLKMTITDSNDKEEILPHLFEPMIISMYHCLAKECNELLNTNFVYDESVIEHCAKAIAIKSLHYDYKWILHNNRDCTEFRPQSKYISCGFSSGTIYGFRWTKEQIISFVEALGGYLSTHDIHKMAYEGEKYEYIYGMSGSILGYYKDICEADEDMSNRVVRYRNM